MSSPLTHLMGRGEELQQSWQCVTKCPPPPPWTCLNGADCSNEAGRTRQSTEEQRKRPGWMCQSPVLWGGGGTLVLGLKDGELGTDWGHSGTLETGTIVPRLGLGGRLVSLGRWEVWWQWAWWMSAPLAFNICGGFLFQPWVLWRAGERAWCDPLVMGPFFTHSPPELFSQAEVCFYAENSFFPELQKITTTTEKLK